MLPRRQGAEWITAPRAHQPGHDLRVECGTARSDPSQGVEEVIDVKHAVLEQVPETPANRQIHRMPRLYGLRQDDDGEVWVLGSGGRSGCDGVALWRRASTSWHTRGFATGVPGPDAVRMLGYVLNFTCRRSAL